MYKKKRYILILHGEKLYFTVCVFFNKIYFFTVNCKNTEKDNNFTRKTGKTTLYISLYPVI